MGFPAQLDHTDPHYPQDETATHFAAREGQVILQITVAVSFIATAVTMATFWFWAWIPAIILLASCFGLFIVNLAEERTRRKRIVTGFGLAEAGERGEGERPVASAAATDRGRTSGNGAFVPIPLLKREGLISLEIVLGVGFAAIVLALVLLPWELVVAGAVLFFLYMLLVMGPVWLGWFGDAEEVERERMGLPSDRSLERVRR